MRKVILWFMLALTTSIGGAAAYYHAWPALVFAVVCVALVIYGLLREWE